MTDTTDPDALYTVNDVMHILGKSEKWVAAQARSGLLPSRKVGRSRRFTAANIATYLERVADGVANPMARTARQAAARNRRKS